MSDMIVAKVYATDDYGKFRFINGNRDIIETQVKLLMTSIEDVGYLPVPILVNEKFEICEGQHRFEACKRLKKPIWYIVKPGIGMREVRSLNAYSKKWSMNDFVHAYATDGDDINYKWLMTLKKKFSEFSFECLMIAAHGYSDTKELRSGRFKFACNYDEASQRLDYMMRFEPLFREGKLKGRKRSFYKVICDCFESPEIDKEWLYESVKKHFDMLPGFSDLDGAYASIEKVYNYCNRKKRSISKLRIERGSKQ